VIGLGSETIHPGYKMVKYWPVLDVIQAFPRFGTATSWVCIHHKIIQTSVNCQAINLAYSLLATLTAAIIIIIQAYYRSSGNMTLPKDLKTFNPQPKPYKSGVVTVEAQGHERVQGETIPRRNAKCPDALVKSPREGLNTMHDILKYASETFGNAKAMGSRKLVHTHNEVKKIKKIVDGKEQEAEKKWTYFELSGYSYMSFVEFEQLALQLGAGLRKLGLQPGDRLHMFAGTQ
jgi:hypothetical protein